MGDASSTAEQRFAALYDEHHPAVLRYARRRVIDDVAADAAAEVFVVAWRRLSEVPDEPLPWLYGVARKVLANQRRGAERALRLAERVAVSTAAIEPTLQRMVDPAERVTATLAIADAFDRLSVEDREVLGLIVWEGLGAREAATVLDCSIAALTMRVTRARRRLRSILGSSEEN